MLKPELVKRLAAKRPLLRESDLERAVNTFLNEIAEALSRGDRVELRGFGVFSVHRRKPQPARNPRTGASIQLGPRCLPAFKIGRQLHSRLNQREATTSGWITVAQPVSDE
jgi:integration host factor subunit beta